MVVVTYIQATSQGLQKLQRPACGNRLKLEIVTFPETNIVHPSISPENSKNLVELVSHTGDQLILWVPKHTFNALRIRFKTEIPIELHNCIQLQEIR